MAVPDVLQQRLRHLLGWENMIDDPRRDRAARHAVELSAFRILDQHHAASRPYLSEAVGSVASGSRQDDANRPFPAVIRQGFEEGIDRVAVAARLGRLGQAQHAAANRQRPVGDDRMDAVGFGDHAVGDLHHRHGGAAAEQLCQSALAGRIQVQNDHEGAPAISGRCLEEAAHRLQSTGRRTNTHDRSHIATPTPSNDPSIRPARIPFTTPLLVHTVRRPLHLPPGRSTPSGPHSRTSHLNFTPFVENSYPK